MKHGISKNEYFRLLRYLYYLGSRQPDYDGSIGQDIEKILNDASHALRQTPFINQRYTNNYATWCEVNDKNDTKIMKTKEQKLEKLKELHHLEDIANKKIGKIDKKIKESLHKLNAEKAKLCKEVSHNMKLRNKIINEL